MNPLRAQDTIRVSLNKAIEIEIAQNNEVRKGYRLDMMGEIYSLKKEFNTAEKYLNEANLIRDIFDSIFDDDDYNSNDKVDGCTYRTK